MVQGLVPVRHVAHFVRDTVHSGLDLDRIVESYSERGYPPYHPAMMVALRFCAYAQVCARLGVLLAAARSSWTLLR